MIDMKTELLNGYEIVGQIRAPRTLVLKVQSRKGPIRIAKVYDSWPPGTTFSDRQRQFIRLMSKATLSLARVYSLGYTSQGHPFIIMQLVHGTEISKLDDIDNILWLVVDFIEGVAGLVKELNLRWLEPSDLVIDKYSGKLRLIDHSVLKDDDGKLEIEESRLVPFGKPFRDLNMMSPEILSHTDIENSAFIYSLARLTLFLQSGKWFGPYDIAKPTKTKNPPEVSTKDELVQSFLLQCIQKHPSDRPCTSLYEFRQKLIDLLVGKSP